MKVDHLQIADSIISHAYANYITDESMAKPLQSIITELEHLEKNHSYFLDQLQSVYSNKEKLEIVDQPFELPKEYDTKYEQIAKMFLSNMDMGTLSDYDDETHCRIIQEGLNDCPYIAHYVSMGVPDN